jgi:dihydrofolate synthase/folylpolyglutamate synthase
MRFDTLDQWLDWQMVLHGKAIDLGLDRVSEVGLRLGLERPARQVVTVAGTNGKGSTVAAYETWLRQAGFEVASYTSPHLLNYNERIKHNLQPVSDTELCGAFAAVERARQDTSLTYFEFGTLAALYLIHRWQPDYAILEVGLGGRLDAVNIVDADLAHLTPIGIDHQAWLGNDREQIGFEKAGILRAGTPVILNDYEPPDSVLREIARLNCKCLRIGRDYAVTRLAGERWQWRCDDLELEFENLLPGVHQAHNLAGVLAGLSQLLPLSEYASDLVRANFRGIQNPGRLQLLKSPLKGQLYVDVGHNPDAARALAVSLESMKQPGGKVVVLLGMLSDKQPDLFVEALHHMVDSWWLLSLDSDRGLSAEQLAERFGSSTEPDQMFASVQEALHHALLSLGNQDIMLVTGSFITVELLLRALSASGE